MSSRKVKGSGGAKPAPSKVAAPQPSSDSLPRYHRIRSLEVQSGFLDGVRLDFDPELNCVIGGRGTGKTTIVELLRFVLRDGQEAAAGSKDWLRLVKDNLGSGIVRVGIETKEGLRYTLERSLTEPVELHTEKGELAGFQYTPALFDCDVYSQNEIEGIANDPGLQLALLDRFVSGEMREVERRIRSLLNELRANAGEILGLELQEREHEDGLNELPALQQQLEAQPKITGAGAEAIQKELALKTLRERELRVLDDYRRLLREGQGAVERAREALTRPAVAPVAPLPEGPNAQLLFRGAQALEDCRQETGEALHVALTAIKRATGEVDAVEAELRAAHKDQEGRYRGLMAQHEAAKGRANERLALERKVLELLERQKALAQVQEALKLKRNERRELVQRLLSERDARFRLRKGVAERLTASLGPQIRVKVTYGDDPALYRDRLYEVFRGAAKQASGLAQAIAQKCQPRDLVRLVLGEKPQELAALAGITPERAAWVLEQLSGTPILYELETVELLDVPTIELLDGDYKGSASLSTGQKCTAILPILLLESEKPLVVDQPEDNLDNRFIFETVVTRILEVKQRRQLLFVTHNPNIPVLGFAGRVFVMGSDGHHAEVVAAGTVDEVKVHVATILEGGKQAFQERRKRYGF